MVTFVDVLDFAAVMDLFGGNFHAADCSGINTSTSLANNVAAATVASSFPFSTTPSACTKCIAVYCTLLARPLVKVFRSLGLPVVKSSRTSVFLYYECSRLLISV